MKTRFFRNISPNSTVFVIVAVAIVYGIFNFLTIYKGKDFPNKNEIQYSEGLLYVEGSTNANYHILLMDEQTNRSTKYSCSYSAFNSKDFSNCVSKGSLDEYIAEKSTIGWYIQKSFLGAVNPHRQLVSIEINGKKVKSYEQTLSKIRSGQKFNIFIYMIVSFFFILIFYSYIKAEKDAELKSKNK